MLTFQSGSAPARHETGQGQDACIGSSSKTCPIKDPMRAGLRAGVAVALAMVLASCGGGGGGQGESQGRTAPPLSSDSYAGICTLDGQKQFTRAYLNDYYLWYSEIPAVNASLYSSVPSYFYDLLTPQLDGNGKLKDRFSFIASSADADSLLTGSNLGYGVSWEQDSQGRTRVAFVEANSPAANAGLKRGAELVSPLNADWYPNAAANINIVYRSSPGASTASATLSAAAVQEDPVPISTALPGNVWYLLFNAHTEGAQDKLISALANAKAAGAQDLVIDMRYNRGGYLSTALALSSMVAGSGADGRVFEQLRFNDKRAAETALATFQFSDQVQYGEQVYATGAMLPRLALPRVYVLTTEDTCSASESVINSLRGIDVEVVIVGKTTCGKPYGMIRGDNCGWAYFAIEFQGVNAKGFGDYANGFAPTCAAEDDFEHPLGDASERLLATAVYHIQNGSCPNPPLATALLGRRGPLTSTAKRPAVLGKLLR
jgi:carboxyl-terminal processing protease